MNGRNDRRTEICRNDTQYKVLAFYAHVATRSGILSHHERMSNRRTNGKKNEQPCPKTLAL